MQILPASESHLEMLARLFDQYRQFYQCEPDPLLARTFIGARLSNGDSSIFVAEDGGPLYGFVQLYPSFCSVEACRIFVLYDLYVVAEHRNTGTGAQLMNRAKNHALEQGAKRIDLLTGHGNFPGQHLYEKCGYRRSNENFYSYSLAL